VPWPKCVLSRAANLIVRVPSMHAHDFRGRVCDMRPRFDEGDDKKRLGGTRYPIIVG